jgi:hypothetical protein
MLILLNLCDDWFGLDLIPNWQLDPTGGSGGRNWFLWREEQQRRLLGIL